MRHPVLDKIITTTVKKACIKRKKSKRFYTHCVNHAYGHYWEMPAYNNDWVKNLSVEVCYSLFRNIPAIQKEIEIPGCYKTFRDIKYDPSKRYYWRDNVEAKDSTSIKNIMIKVLVNNSFDEYNNTNPIYYVDITRFGKFGYEGKHWCEVLWEQFFKQKVNVLGEVSIFLI